MNADDNRRIARNTMYLYIRTFITMLIGLYTSRKILELLGVTDFGIFNIVGGITVMLTFLNGSIGTAIQRYLTFELGRKDYEAYNRVFNTSLIIQSGLALLLIVLAETVGLWFVNTQLVIPAERMTAANCVYQVTVLSTVMSIMTGPFNATIISHERMHIVAYLGMGEATLKLVLVLLLGVVPWDRLITWSGMYIAITICVTSFQIVYCHRHFPHCRVTLRRDRGIVRSMLSFSGWNLFGTIAWLLKDQGANVVLNLFGGPAVNAARGVSYQVKGAILGLTSGFQGAVNPQLVKSYAADDVRSTHRLLCVSSKISYFLLLLPAIPVCFECSYLLELWLVDVPTMTVVFTVLVVIETLCEVFAGPLINTIMATGRIKWYQIVVGSTLLINVPVSYLLLWLGFPIYAPFVVGIAFILACNALRLLFCRQQTGLSLRGYFGAVIVRCILVTAVAVVLPLVVSLTMPDGFVRLMVMIAVSMLSTAATIWAIGLEPAERQFVKERILQRFIRKSKSPAS